jgi:hypothetical protein
MMNHLRRPGERALSRRCFLRTAAGLTGGMLGSGLLFPARAWGQRPADPAVFGHERNGVFFR